MLEAMAGVRRVVELGHQARGDAGLKLRQPLRRAYVRGADGASGLVDEIADELNVKEVLFDEGPVARSSSSPTFAAARPAARRAAAGGEVGARRRRLRGADGGGVRVAGEELAADEVLRGERLAVEGFAIGEDGEVSVALDTALDDELIREGRVRELVHRLNAMRKDAGLELTDRIVVTLGPDDADLLDYEDWIKEETLAVEVFVGDETAIEKPSG